MNHPVRRKPRSQDAAPKDARDAPIIRKLTGIMGFDEISRGGLPEGRLTSIIGGPGAGKTVFALQTLVNRKVTDGEPGIFVTFEEPIDRIRRNMASFDWQFHDFGPHGLTFVDAKVPFDTVLAGAFDLSGLLASLSALVEETGAKNIVFDGIDMLLSSLPKVRMERQELARLDEWIQQANLSAIVTVKSFGLSDRDQLRSDFLQYITDCVVVLEGSTTEIASSRSLRIVKYRGSGFAANPVPVVIDRAGFEVVAFKGSRLNYPTFTERISSGIPRLDTLIDGGYIRGSSILISGSPGTSKTSLSASFILAACKKGAKAMFISFDESASQIVTNMRSIGIELQPHIETGRLIMVSLVSSGRSPQEHFTAICRLLESHAPDCLVIDPLSSLLKAQYPFTELICEALIDFVKTRGITVLCTSLLSPVGGEQELSASRVSAIADTWIQVSYVANEGERHRALTVIKSRGTGHSNQVRELVLDRSGVDLVDVYVAEGEVLMGSARTQKEAEDRRQLALEDLSFQHARRELDREVAELKARVEAANHELDWKEKEAAFLDASEGDRVERKRIGAKIRLDLRRADDDADRKSTSSNRKKRTP